jgi:hypothetical protein
MQTIDTSGQVQPLAQEVHAHQHVERPLAQLAEDRHALDRVQLRVQPLAAQALLLQKPREVLGQPLGQGRDQDAFPLLGALAGLFQERRHLAPRGLDPHDRVHQAGRADDLFDDLAAAHRQLVVAGRGRDVDARPQLLLPLIESQGAIVQGAGQAEPVLDQGALAAEVPGEHPAHLRHAHVGLVDEQQAVGREEIQEGVRRLPRHPAREGPAVVLHPLAVADLQ